MAAQLHAVQLRADAEDCAAQGHAAALAGAVLVRAGLVSAVVVTAVLVTAVFVTAVLEPGRLAAARRGADIARLCATVGDPWLHHAAGEALVRACLAQRPGCHDRTSCGGERRSRRAGASRRDARERL